MKTNEFQCKTCMKESFTSSKSLSNHKRWCDGNMKSKPHSEETKKKIGLSVSGKKSGRYKHGFHTNKNYSAIVRLTKERNPEKYKARVILRNAVNQALIFKPEICDNCCEVKLLEGHHHNYSKPLDVEWLCKSCHLEVHNGKF